MAAADKTKTEIKTNGFNAPAVVLSGLAVIIFLYALSLFLQGGFLAAQAQQYDTKVLAPENEALNTAQAEQQAILDEPPRLLDEATGRYCLPVDAAKDRLVEKAAAAAQESSQ